MMTTWPCAPGPGSVHHLTSVHTQRTSQTHFHPVQFEQKSLTIHTVCPRVSNSPRNLIQSKCKNCWRWNVSSVISFIHCVYVHMMHFCSVRSWRITLINIVIDSWHEFVIITFSHSILTDKCLKWRSLTGSSGFMWLDLCCECCCVVHLWVTVIQWINYTLNSSVKKCWHSPLSASCLNNWFTFISIWNKSLITQQIHRNHFFILTESNVWFWWQLLKFKVNFS